MDMGGEPERDESGLPPADVAIPDDARELDRDLQAYRRELRAARRRRRIRRLTAPLTGHGMVIPLIAGMLAVTLFAGTMLTVITSAPERAAPLPQPPQTTASAPAPQDGQLGGLLPDAVVRVDNKRSPLRGLSRSVLAMIPRRCQCMAALRQLTRQAVAANVPIYFVGTDGWVKQVAGLAAGMGRGVVHVVDDAKNVLGIYRPAGLTAILVHSDSAVTDVRRELSPGVHLGARLRQLAAPGLGHPASPAPG